MLGIVFYLLLAVSLGLFGKLYHSSGLNDPLIASMIMLSICCIGFSLSLVFIQRLVFFLAFLLFPFNILFSFSFKSTLLNGLEPIGATLMILGFLSLAFLRKL
ncbi:MAG: hypothetical protein NZT61_07150 [Deltaproteobacteria bacterium]|nr:hypothetical protein [Deltaproteobacteria bacterium]